MAMLVYRRVTGEFVSLMSSPRRLPRHTSGAGASHVSWPPKSLTSRSKSGKLAAPMTLGTSRSMVAMAYLRATTGVKEKRGEEGGSGN